MPHYVHDENNNRVLAYSAQEILSVIAQMIEDGDFDNVTADAAFITRLKSVADNGTYEVAFIKQSDYNALEQAGTVAENTLYIITDDSTLPDLENALQTLAEQINAAIATINNYIGSCGEALTLGELVDPTLGTKQYAAANRIGLYACNISIDSDNVCSAMVSVGDLTKDTFDIAYDGATQIPVKFDASAQKIYVNSSAAYDLIDCRLVARFL